MHARQENVAQHAGAGNTLRGINRTISLIESLLLTTAMNRSD